MTGVIVVNGGRAEHRQSPTCAAAAEGSESAELCRRVVAGDRAAFQTIYDDHVGACLALARRVTGSAEAAEEVVQIVFVDFWRRSAHRYDGQRGSIRPFLLTRVRSRSIDRNRAETACKTREYRIGLAHVRACTTEGVESEVGRSDEAARVRRAVSRLCPQQRVAIELAYFAHLSYREVAAALNTPEGTIKSQIRAGLQQLRVQLRAEP